MEFTRMHNTLTFFEQIFQNAKTNAILIMNGDGIVESVNEAFTTAYGYTTEDLQSKHFRILYVEKDQITRRSEIELNVTHREGSAPDENYLVHKDGTPIWVTGESILISSENPPVIVKLIHNIHAQKQLERYLLATSELLENLFESVQLSGLLLLDTRMRIVKANEAFRKMFTITDPVTEESKLQDLGHPFWSADEIKTDVRNALVNGTNINKEYIIADGNEQLDKINITSKLIVSDDTTDKKLLLMVKAV